MEIPYPCDVVWHDHYVIEKIIEYLFKYFLKVLTLFQLLFSIKGKNSMSILYNENHISIYLI